MRVLHTVALVLVIIGALNWGLVGLLNLDLVAKIFGAGILAKIIYVLVGLAGVACLTIFPVLGGRRRDIVATTV